MIPGEPGHVVIIAPQIKDAGHDLPERGFRDAKFWAAVRCGDGQPHRPESIRSIPPFESGSALPGVSAAAFSGMIFQISNTDLSRISSYQPKFTSSSIQLGISGSTSEVINSATLFIRTMRLSSMGAVTHGTI
jgi:hypothetical protein